MPTHEETDRFWRDWKRLSADEKRRFLEVVKRFSEDLEQRPPGQFRKGIRVKSMQGTDGIFEIAWAPNGRATFEYGRERTKGDPHIVWRRIGGHDIFGSP